MQTEQQGSVEEALGASPIVRGHVVQADTKVALEVPGTDKALTAHTDQPGDSGLKAVQEHLAAATARGSGISFSAGWATSAPRQPLACARADAPGPSHSYAWRSQLSQGAFARSLLPIADLQDPADVVNVGDWSSSDEDAELPAGSPPPASRSSTQLGFRSQGGYTRSDIKRYGVDVPSLTKWERDMTFEDLFPEDMVPAHSEVAPALKAATLAGARCHWQDCTDVHQICAAKEPADLDRHLLGERHSIFRADGDHDHGRIRSQAAAQIYQPNAAGQLPLHVAARTNRTFGAGAGQDDAEALAHTYQPGPGLVTTLLTGRSVKTGTKLFGARKEDGKDLSCLHQDVLGMTPLHAAVRSNCDRANLVVAVLLEANPDAALIPDMDGLLPIDLAVRILPLIASPLLA